MEIINQKSDYKNIAKLANSVLQPVPTPTKLERKERKTRYKQLFSKLSKKERKAEKRKAREFFESIKNFKL